MSYLPALDAETQEILSLCAVSTKMCAKTLFPERFHADFSPEIHDPIFTAIDSGHPRIVIAAPRGIGKSSIVGLALTARKILFELANFILYVSMSFDAAERQTENLKIELSTNRVIRSLFGSLKTKSADGAEGIDESFSKKAWVARGNTLVFPRGSGQQVRGLLYRNYRPDLIVVDDLEDPETIDSEEQRAKRKQWFFADLIKCVSRISKNYQIVYIDTLKHHDALLQHLLEDPNWLGLRLEICDDNLKSKAPSFLSDDDVKREYEQHRVQHQLDVFAREYRNIPIAKEDAVFKEEFFRYYEEAQLLQLPRIENVVLVDPAKTVKLSSADSAIVGVGIDRVGHALYVRDIVAGKLHPDELINEAFGMCERLGARVLGVEVTSLNEFITQPIRNEMMARGKFYELIELSPRGGSKGTASKADRIAALAPYYRQGYIYHNRNCCHQLEQQLIEFPRPRRWDVMDAFAYVVEMLDLGERYFSPAGDEDEDPEVEFAALRKDDEPRMENWRAM